MELEEFRVMPIFFPGMATQLVSSLAMGTGEETVGHQHAHGKVEKLYNISVAFY